MAKTITIWKACQNDSCNQKHALVKCLVTDKYCTKCGQPLMHVCIRCGRPIANDLQKMCDICKEAQKERQKENRQQVLETVKGAAKVVPAVVVPAFKFATDKAKADQAINVLNKAIKVVKTVKK